MFHRPPTPFFYQSSGLHPAQRQLSTPSQITQPQSSTFKPQVSPKPTQIKPFVFVHSIPPTFLFIGPRPSVPTSLSTLNIQPMPIRSLSNPPKPLTSSQHWNRPSTITLPSSVIGHSPTVIPPTSQILKSPPFPYPYTLNVSTCVPLSSHLQTFDNTDY